MSRGITEQDVWQAADTLLIEGARPTIERVRQKLGRGSPNTVSPHLDAWFARLGPRLQGMQAAGPMQEPPEPMLAAARQLWQQALASARAEVEAAYMRRGEELELQRRQLAEDRAQMQAEAERSAARQQGLHEALAALRAQLDESARERERLEARLQAQRSEAATLQAEARASRELAQQLAGQLDRQRQEHEAERRRIEERAAAHERRWVLELDRTRDALKQLQSRHSAAEAQAARAATQARAERERLEAELRDARAASARQAQEAESAALQLRQARQALDELRQGASRQAEELMAQQQRLQVRLDETLAQLKTRDEEQGALLRSLAAGGARRRTRRREAPPE